MARNDVPRRHVVDGARLFVIISIFLCSVVIGLSVIAPPIAPPGEIALTSTPTSTPFPTATSIPPTPVVLTLNQVHSLHDGCFSGAPAPQRSLIIAARNQVSKTPGPNEVALTFDDGPTPYTTPAMLTYLEKTHTPATFFVEGKFISLWPELLQREWKDGFAIGVHTWNHPDLKLTPPSQYPHQFGDTLAAMHRILGADACIWLFRPPYGSINPTVFAAVQSFHLTAVNWDSSGADWTLPGPENIAALALRLSHPGSIILLHDGPAGREQTLHALPLILAGLKAKGLKPVPLPKLLADYHYAGVVVPDYPIPDPTVLPVTP